MTRGVQDLQFKLAGADDVPFGQRYRSERKVYDEWVVWNRHQRVYASERRRHRQPAMLDRLDWYSAHN